MSLWTAKHIPCPCGLRKCRAERPDRPCREYGRLSAEVRAVSQFHEQDKPFAYAAEGFRLRPERGPHRTCGTCYSREDDQEAGRKRARLLHRVLHGSGDAPRTIQQPLRDSFERSRLRPARSACAKAVRRRPLRTRGIVRGAGETPGANRKATRSEKGRCAQEARSATGEGHEEGCATKGF